MRGPHIFWGKKSAVKNLEKQILKKVLKYTVYKVFISTRDKAKLLVKRCTFAQPSDFSEMLFLKF